ncbi:MAG: hypothetical protein RRZ32_02105, partial [Acinetobacter sp.]
KCVIVASRACNKAKVKDGRTCFIEESFILNCKYINLFSETKHQSTTLFSSIKNKSPFVVICMAFLYKYWKLKTSLSYSDLSDNLALSGRN